MSVVIFNNMFDDFLISMPLSNIIWDVLNISTNQEPEGFLLLPARNNYMMSIARQAFKVYFYKYFYWSVKRSKR